jgi:hypothetical protein
MYIHHIYTSISTVQGQISRHRHLGHETIHHHRRALHTLVEPFQQVTNLAKRGFIANPNVPAVQAQFILPTGVQVRYLTWNWKRND